MRCLALRAVSLRRPTDPPVPVKLFGRGVTVPVHVGAEPAQVE